MVTDWRNPARLADLATRRAVALHLLLAPLSGPTPAFSAALDDGSYATALLGTGLWLREDRQVAILAGLASGGGAADAEARFLDREDEYVRLFVAGPKVPCPLYASIQLGCGQLMAEPALAAKEAYAAAGATIAEGGGLLPDHLTVELHFLGWLSRMEASIWRRARRDRHAWKQASSVVANQHAFVTGHLMPWVPRLCAEMAQNGRHPLFPALAVLLEGRLRRELEWTGWLCRCLEAAGLTHSPRLQHEPKEVRA